MAIVQSSALKTYFQVGDQPTCSQFVDFIDTAAPTSAAAIGSLIQIQHTTASGQTILGAGAAGITIFEAATTAALRTLVSGAP